MVRKKTTKKLMKSNILTFLLILKLLASIKIHELKNKYIAKYVGSGAKEANPLDKSVRPGVKKFTRLGFCISKNPKKIHKTLKKINNFTFPITRIWKNNL